MMKKSLMVELLEEEIAKLLYFIERHRKWGRENDEPESARDQRVVADTLKDAIEANQILIEKIKEG